MKLKAYAKINLALDVVRRREDGYHEVRMIMQTVDLYDKLELYVSSEPGIFITANLPYIPVNEDNLCYKAAKLLMDEFNVKEGLSINLIKKIPVAAGMAGGSSDAAAVMVGVNKLYNMGLSIEQLKERAVRIGADVPYCIMRGTALSEGIGEVLTKMPPMPECHIVVAKPPISVSTKYVYENLKLDTIEEHPDVDGMVRALKEGSLEGICSRMENVLESVTVRKHPVISRIKEICMEMGAKNALMSGSGPTVFAIFDTYEDADDAKQRIIAQGLARQVYVTEPRNFC